MGSCQILTISAGQDMFFFGGGVKSIFQELSSVHMAFEFGLLAAEMCKWLAGQCMFEHGSRQCSSAQELV